MNKKINIKKEAELIAQLKPTKIKLTPKQSKMFEEAIQKNVKLKSQLDFETFCYEMDKQHIKSMRSTLGMFGVFHFVTFCIFIIFLVALYGVYFDIPYLPEADERALLIAAVWYTPIKFALDSLTMYIKDRAIKKGVDEMAIVNRRRGVRISALKKRLGINKTRTKKEKPRKFYRKKK